LQTAGTGSGHPPAPAGPAQARELAAKGRKIKDRKISARIFLPKIFLPKSRFMESRLFLLDLLGAPEPKTGAKSFGEDKDEKCSTRTPKLNHGWTRISRPAQRSVRRVTLGLGKLPALDR
jgi:hypothetical protein